MTDDAEVEAVLAASRALVALSARSIAGVEGVTLPQFRMLVVLDEGPRSQVQLAQALDVAPSTALRMVDRLLAAGLVERTVDPADRRAVRLALSATGRRAVRTVVRRRRADLRAVLSRMPAVERAELARVLQSFADAASLL